MTVAIYIAIGVMAVALGAALIACLVIACTVVYDRALAWQARRLWRQRRRDLQRGVARRL